VLPGLGAGVSFGLLLVSAGFVSSFFSFGVSSGVNLMIFLRFSTSSFFSPPAFASVVPLDASGFSPPVVFEGSGCVPELSFSSFNFISTPPVHHIYPRSTKRKTRISYL